ncbi:hypothetical protein [Dyella solisilvae]|uniref:hypothetical protein n=1 Tax=Dyella solisilvae TaxID=1920168 RepID=UPI001314340A|nr:hypothetical protein [Dyella solisilvae]
MYSLSTLTKSDVRAYEDYIEALEVTVSAAESRLSAISLLWDLRTELGEAMNFRPYGSRGSLRKCARRIGRADGHTPTLKPEFFFKLLDHSLGLVAGGERWAELADAYLQCRYSQTAAKRFSRQFGVAPRQLIAHCRILYGACVVVMFSLLGHRIHELTLLSIANVREMEVTDSKSIRGRVTKSSNGSGGTKTASSAPAELKAALRLAARLAGVSFDEEGSFFRPILLDRNLQVKHRKSLDAHKVYRLMDQVARSDGIPIRTRPHMFRRAYSMIFVWRYEFGDLAYLREFLHHNDLRHTVTYTQGDDVREFLSEAERDLSMSIMERALHGGEVFVGGFGVVLNRVARRLQSMTVALRPDQVSEWINAQHEQGKLTIRPAPHGYCVIVGDRGKRAACSTDGKTPNYANRVDAHCVRCLNFLTRESRRSYWEESKEAHWSVFKTAKVKALKQAAKAGFEIAKRMLRALSRATHGK